MGDLPALRVRDLHKRFGGLLVLRGIDLDLHAGEILALVGENGAGKSTLVQCVARTYSSDRGRVEMGGQPLAPDPTLARAQGLAVVWQDLALCDNLTVVANLFLGNERLDGVFLDEFAMAGRGPGPLRAPEDHRGQPPPARGHPVGRPAPAGRHRPGRAASTVGAHRSTSPPPRWA